MNGPHPPSRRWTVIASGLLCGLLALVVIFTNRGAFYSPIAVMIVSAIGLAAVLLQTRLRNREQAGGVHPPMLLNALGIVLALAALFADFLKLGSGVAQTAALGAVACFAVCSAIILQAFRKARAISRSAATPGE